MMRSMHTDVEYANEEQTRQDAHHEDDTNDEIIGKGIEGDARNHGDQ